MRSLYFCLIGAFLMVCLPVITSAAETTVTFPKPGEPGILRIVSGSGNITVTGYDGRDVVIESDAGQLEEVQATDEKAKGLKRITMNAFGISKIEDENTILINRSTRQKMDLTIRVPAKTSIVIGGRAIGSGNLEGDVFDFVNEQLSAAEEQAKQLAQQAPQAPQAPNNRSTGSVAVPLTSLTGGSIAEGDITVSNITGNVEVSAIEGDIDLTGISGVVNASTVNGDVAVVMNRITAGESPLYFSSVDGDVDVTIPSDTKASLTMQTVDGDVYTDFDLTINSSVAGTGQNRSTGSAAATAGSSGSRSTVPQARKTPFGVITGNTVNGDINGGGREIRLSSVDGSIYLRKGK